MPCGKKIVFRFKTAPDMTRYFGLNIGDKFLYIGTNEKYSIENGWIGAQQVATYFGFEDRCIITDAERGLGIGWDRFICKAEGQLRLFQ